MSEEMVCRKRRLSSFQIIILGFAGVILLGALLLMLPISATARCVTPFHEALFTATSAVCVTGLVVQDTGSYWSVFGQAVILTLIQIGGLGVVTVAASFAYKPEAEDAEIEEIKEENENLNLSDLSKQMIEKALERNKPGS